MKLTAAAALGFALQITSAEASVCHGRSSLSPDETTEDMVGDQGGIECLVDNILSRELAEFGLRPDSIISTSMGSARIGASEGRPQIVYRFQYQVSWEQFDLFPRLWVEKSSSFTELGSSVAKEISARVCADETGEAAYFAAGGRAQITITLWCIDGRGRAFYEELVSFEIASCEAT